MVSFEDAKCPLCGSDKRVSIGKPQVNTLFNKLNLAQLSDVRVVKCCSCSLFYAFPFPIFSSDILNQMYLADYFDEFTPYWDNVCHVINPNRRFDVAERIASSPIKTYLEIGCGQGYALHEAKKRGWDIYGQDISGDFASIVKKRVGIDIKTAAITENSFPKSFFDLIYIDSVIEHVENPVQYMKNILSFLSPCGVVYLILPNEDALPKKIVDLIFRLAHSSSTSRIAPFIEPYHVTGFSKKSITFLADLINAKIRLLTCKYSYDSVKKTGGRETIKRIGRRHIFGMVHTIADSINDGVNMEVILTR